MPITFVSYAAETSFVAYNHYLDDIANVIGGLFGRGVDGVYASMRLHPPVRALAPAQLTPETTQRVAAALARSWERLALVDNAIDTSNYDRQANAVVPGLVMQAVTDAGRALVLALDAVEPVDVLSFLGDLTTEELFPYPWSAHCFGCPQLATADWGGGVLPGKSVSVFATPDPATSDARFAMLLRTTRQRALERAFAVARQTDVRPGRTRRNLTAEHKEELAASFAPTTLFDVLDRVARRVDADDGEAFVTGAFDDDEALGFARTLAGVGDASVAAIESVVATVIGWDVFGDLVASGARRTGGVPAITRRLAGI